LEQPFPRTADPAAFVPFEVDGRTHVTLDVLDADGNPVARLAEGVYAGGRHAVRWRGCDGAGRRVAPGVYTVRMNAGGRIRTRVLPVLG
jgi:flagellar hook assembly protein FlgD